MLQQREQGAVPVSVLVVDDDEFVRGGLRTYLEAAGLLIHEAADEQTAWQAALLSLDLALRGGDARSGYFWEGLDLRSLLVAVPLATTYTILRYRALRTAHPVFIRVFVLAGSAVLASVANWLWFLFLPTDQVAQRPSFVPLLAVTLVMGAFWGTQTPWRGTLSRLLQWDQRSYHDARAFGDAIAGHPAAADRRPTDRATLDPASRHLGLGRGAL